MITQRGERASWKGDSLEDFTCEKKPEETEKMHVLRKQRELENFAAEKMCKFRAVGLKQKNGTWKLRQFDGHTFIPHDEYCLCVGTATGRVLVDMMKPAISSNPKMTGKQRDKALVSAEMPLNRAMLPKRSSRYRAQKAVRDEELKYYNIYGSRVETYIHDLGRDNLSWHTRVEKDFHGHFKRFFVGIGSSLRICRLAGLDHYALDSTFTKHTVVNGMQYHILCGRSGANRRIPLAISLEQTESCETYEYFARECKKFGVGEVLELVPGKFARRCCVVSDGFKGTNKFTDEFNAASPKVSPFRSLCAKHLADSCRSQLRKMKTKNPAVNCGFHDAQVYRLAGAASEEDFDAEIQKLQRNFPHAAQYLKEHDPSTWNYFSMAQKRGVGSFGHKTSNTVEGLNGTIVEFRKMHPYLFLDEFVQMLQASFAKHAAEVRKWKMESKLITPYASNIFAKEKELARSNNYDITVTSEPETVVVCDRTSTYRVRHTVCYSPHGPSCKPCNIWCQHKIPCRHMLVALGTYKRDVLLNKESFSRDYFHPAYHIESLSAAYDNVRFKIPNAKLGPEEISLVSDSDVEEDEKSELTRGASSSSWSAPARTGAQMLPPRKYTLETYKKNKQRGRPRKKRIRSNGAMPGDRGGRKKRRLEVNVKEVHEVLAQIPDF